MRKQTGFSLPNLLIDYTVAQNSEFADLTWEYVAVSEKLKLRIRVGENLMTLILNQTSQKSLEHTGDMGRGNCMGGLPKDLDLSH